MLKFHRLPIHIKMLLLAALLALPVLGMTIHFGLGDGHVYFIDHKVLLASLQLIVFALVWVISKRTILERINALETASQRLAAGDQQARVPGISELEPGDELWSLGQTFNVMAWQLEAREQQRRHSQERLRESEERFRSAFFEAGIGMAMGSPEGRLLRANETFCEFIGYDESELLGRTFKDITVTEDFPRELELVERLIWGKISKYNIEKRYRHKDGHIIWGQVNVSLVRDSSGNPGYFIAQIQDITDRKRADQALQKSESRFRMLFERTDSAILLLDARTNHFVDANPAALKMLRCLYEEIVWFTPVDFSPEKQPDGRLSHEKAREMIAKAVRHGSHRYEWIHRSSHRHDFPAEVQLTPIETGETPLMIVTWRDITEQKKAEQVLLNYQERLAELAAELSLAEERERHRIATELHDQIGQHLALSSMRLSALDMFQLPDNVCREVSSIKDRLDNSIEGIRTLISQLSPPILSEMGLEAALKWLGRTMQHDWCLTVTISEEGPPLSINHEIRSTIFRIVRELLTNVVKHACTDQVWIELLREDKGISVRVEDHGTGFALEQTDMSRPQQGGFGLFSIRQKIRYLKGDFSVQSEPGRLTRVMFKIPLPGIAPAADQG